MAALPQFPLLDDDEEGTQELIEFQEDDDWTAPAPPPQRPFVRQFVLELPEWMTRQLEAQRPKAPSIELRTPPAWSVDSITRPQPTLPPAAAERVNPLLVRAGIALAGALFLVGAFAGVSAARESGNDVPIGVVRHAPKILAPSIRAHDRITGTKQKVATVSIDSLARPHHHRRK